VEPAALVRRWLAPRADGLSLSDPRGTPLGSHAGPVFLAGAGKAAVAMARGAAEVLGRVPAAVIVPDPARDVGGIAVLAGGHPLPTAASVAASSTLVDALAATTSDTLILFLLSGGASALFCLPCPGIALADKIDTTARLLRSGADIGEINVVRKHLSSVKGGGLARRVGGRKLWTLVLSDVVGDDLATIGSGPTAPDPSTFPDALAVLDRYGLAGGLPAAVLGHLRAGAGGARRETPKPGDPCFDRVVNVVVGNNREALDAAAACARGLRCEAEVWSAPITGDTLTGAVRFARALVHRRRAIRRRTCVVAGGETTVRVRGRGRGGRNQEFALAAAMALDGITGIALLSAGTDGIDGPTDAAGGVVDGGTLAAARRRGLDVRAALADNDAYGFLSALGALFVPGATGTNVMDVKIALLDPPVVCGPSV
jgi:glycerate-2-kinase